MRNCWMCKYFYTSTKDEPCVNCTEKKNFQLWFNENVNSPITNEV